MADFSKFKDFTEALKNIFTLLFYVAIVTALYIIYPWIKNEIGDKQNGQWHLKTINIPGVGTIERSQAPGVLTSLVATSGSKDVDVAPALSQTAKAIDSISGSNHFWVYLGQAQNGRFIDKNFDFSQTPTPHTNLKANTSVYKRNSAPIQSSNGTWKLGDIVGVVSENAIIRVDSIIEIEGENYWAFTH